MNKTLKTYCLNTQQIEYTEYTEYTDDALYIDKYYEITNPNGISCVAIPDATLDIQCIWEGGNSKIVIAGCLVNGAVSALSSAEKCFGIRINSNSIPTFLEGRMEELITNRIPLTEFISIPNELKKIKQDMPFLDKISYMKKVIDKIEFVEHGKLVTYLTNNIYACRGNLNIDELTKSTGYSHRYVNDVFKHEMGMSIKKYANILRNQNGIKYVIENREDDIYSNLHYYDQAHFIHDFKQFTTFTPNRFKKMIEEDVMKVV